MRRAMSLGLLRKNGSMMPTATPACHAPTRTTATAIREKPTDARSDTLRFRLAFHDFFAQHRPNLSVERFEGRRRSQVEKVSWPFQSDGVPRNDVARGCRREDDHLIGQRDGLFEV